MNQNTKMLIGAVIAAALAIAVYYGAISQQTANNIQGQASQTLGTPPGAQQPTQPQGDARNTNAPNTNTQTTNTPTAAPAPQTTTPHTTAPQAPAPTTGH